MTESLTYDIFISHAFEDKEAFANELAMELTKSGLKVWYSGFDLKLGDSISTSINDALKKSAFGIVLISPVYFRKQWAMNELNALFAQEKGQNRILPILHNISVDEIRNHFPILADRYMISSDKGMNAVVNKILQTMSRMKKKHPDTSFNSHQATSDSTSNPEKSADRKNSTQSKSANNTTAKSGTNTLVVLILIILIIIGLYYFFQASGGSEPGIDKEHIFPSNTH